MEDHKKQLLETEFGQRATVTREELSSELNTRANQTIRSVGEALNPSPNGLQYLGSAAVHVYQSPVLGQVMFVSQTGCIGHTPEALASKAVHDLKGSLMEQYGKKRRVLRSGF